jgi:hypothetical protein
MLYSIFIRGHLDDRWSHWFEEMTIHALDDGGSVLSGEILDQAALHGVLDRVRDLGLTLLAVIPGASPETDAGASPVDNTTPEQV